MDDSDKNELMKHYVKGFYKIYRILELTGFCRFIIKNGKAVERNLGTKLYNICVLIVADFCAAYLLWFGDAKDLGLIEYIAIAHFTIFSNLLILDITFGNQYRGLDLIQDCIEIDNLLGAKETVFLREVSLKFYKFLILFLRITQVFIVSCMYYVFNVSMAVHVVGTVYFFWMFFGYDDYFFFVYMSLSLSMRVRYLNIALMKITNMKIEYIPKQYVFNKLFWKDEYDERVTFHTRSKDFCGILRMLYRQLRRLEKCYRFTLVLGVITIAMGSIVAVQTFIMYIQTENTMVIRGTAISGWSVASWFHLLLISLPIDFFYTQLEQTKLICAYIQLKPNTSAENLKLTKNIFNTIEVRSARVSLYGMSDFNTGFALKIAATTFVFITVQLQLAFPNLKEVHKVRNISGPPIDFDFNPSKVKEYWFF